VWNDEVRWTTGQLHLSAIVHCPSTAFLPVWPHYVNARQNRRQEDLNRFPPGEIEETTRTSLYYVDEDYPARPEIQQPLPE